MCAQMKPDHIPTISVIIPTRNEADDIGDTLTTCLDLDYPKKEIIVVDDSSDETPDIVQQYASQGVRLIHRENNRNGCCGARTLGMQSSCGEITVLLNADDRPESDFLKKILVHYKKGADYVIVNSAVKNQTTIWGKFMRAYELFVDRWINPDPEWSEGFSCRKGAAESVGYFPGDFPMAFCRDYMLGKALGNAGFKKIVDNEICVQHIVPETLKGFWQNRVWRGTFSAPNLFYFQNISPIVILFRETIKAFRTLLKYGLLFPGFIMAVRLTRCADRAWRYVMPFLFACFVQDLALNVGNFKGLLKLIQIEKGTKIHRYLFDPKQ